MANAVTRRECTNETWMTMGSRRRTSAATAACGRYLASKVKLVCTASLGTPVVPEVCVMSAGSWGLGMTAGAGPAGVSAESVTACG
ncbi:Uncharacterised protein [Mycobacteroides abscessus]|nr:Uncharacterised protein [Mycobacteroides abscessus]